jgi:hypothetical protein
MARKLVAKKLKVMETTSQEVDSSSRVVEYLSFNVVYADNKIPFLAEDSAFRPRRPRGRRRLGDGGGAGWKKPQSSPHHGRTRVAIDTSAPVAEGRTEPAAAAAAEEPAATEAEEEALAEAGLVDIASIFGAPTVIVVRSSL